MSSDLAGEIGFLEEKLASALLGARVAEQAAVDAAAAVERIQQTLKDRQRRLIKQKRGAEAP